MRILIWLIIGLAVVVWIKRALARVAHQGSDGAPAGTARPRQRQEHIEAMVQCAHCGVHFPASEAVSGAGGALYCSAEHRQIAQQ
jgi:uncharacterized protein